MASDSTRAISLSRAIEAPDNKCQGTETDAECFGIRYERSLSCKVLIIL